MNSHIAWFCLAGWAAILRGGFIRLFNQNVEQFPVPDADKNSRDRLSNLARLSQQSAKSAWDCQDAFRRRIPDLCPRDRDPKLNTKLTDWWTLENFAAFRDEIKKHYKAEIPLNERTQWEDWFKTGKTEIDKLSAGIARNEAEINTIVYRLFDLTSDEIKLLEDSLR